MQDVSVHVRQLKLSTYHCTVNIFSIKPQNRYKNIIGWPNLALIFLLKTLRSTDYQWKGAYCIRLREEFWLAHPCLRQLQYILAWDLFFPWRWDVFSKWGTHNQSSYVYWLSGSETIRLSITWKIWLRWKWDIGN